MLITAYRTEEGKPYYIPVVKKAEGLVLQSTVNHEYLPILGFEPFTKAASQLLLGDITQRQEEGTVIIYFTLCFINHVYFIKHLDIVSDSYIVLLFYVGNLLYCVDKCMLRFFWNAMYSL